jgi:hypothetical protein
MAMPLIETTERILAKRSVPGRKGCIRGLATLTRDCTSAHTWSFRIGTAVDG